MAKIIFRLTGKDTPLSWEVPQENVMAVKGDKGKKFINYYKGQDSIYTEDLTNKDIRPSKVPDFVYNALTKATELQVDDTDRSLLNYLKAHPWNGKKWKLHSKEIEADAKLSQFDKVEKALDYIKDADEMKVKANAIAVFGLHAFAKSTKECSAELKEKAIKNPDVIIRAFEADNYQVRFLASLAFCKGIIKNNLTSTAVVWNDEKEGTIVHVATGENGIDKLADFLAEKNDASLIVMQEFEKRMNKVPTITPVDAQAEIQRLKLQLAEATKNNEPAPVNNISYDGFTTEELQELYKEKKNAPVPPAQKNNRDWLIKKIAEA